MCVLFRSYYESNDLPSALGVIEDALARHPALVSDDVINMAAELHIANHQYNKALEVRVCVIEAPIRRDPIRVQVTCVLMDTHLCFPRSCPSLQV